MTSVRYLFSAYRAKSWHFAALLVVAQFLLAAHAWAELGADDERRTPRGAVATFLDAVEHDEREQIALALGVASNAAPARYAEALRLGRQLGAVLTKSASFDLDRLSDDPNGKPEDGANSERIATLRGADHEVPIVLERSRVLPGSWSFSRGTQSRIPELYQRYGPSPLEAHVPKELKRELIGLPAWQWLGLIAAVAAAILIGRGVAYAFHRIGKRLASRTRLLWDDELVGALHAPGRLFLSVCAYVPLVHALSLPGGARLVSIRVTGTLGIFALAWAVIRVVGVISNVVERRATSASGGESPRSARAAQTQVRVLRRVTNVVLSICAGAVVLMQFDVVRSVGISLLASAGFAGVVVGLAAQRTLASILAGIQLSITQPIRIGDEVLVENEFGTIEEITLTYVVVRVWDERRLIVPMTRFLEQPFQNWTKVSSSLHGTVLLQADFTLPVDALRAEVDRLIEDDPRWDRRTKVVHVTDARERTIEVRVLVSAANGGALFDLRTKLREALAAWLSRYEGGRYLPALRVAAPDSRTSNERPIDLARRQIARG